MGYIRQKPIYISLPGMEVHLTTYFFGGIDDRPASKHTHPCYEIVSVENDKGVFFTIIPPLMEHFAKTAEPGKLCSILFTFTQECENDICRILETIDKVIEIQDTFDGIARIKAVKESFSRNDVGMDEQVVAELRLFFVRLAQTFQTQKKDPRYYTQTLEEERIALLNDFFNIEMRYPDCTKQQLAAKLGVCERQLTRILKETYNNNFSAILMESRMNMAQAMLNKGGMTVEKIAEAVGYTSVHSFRKAYINFFGHSPKKKEDTTE